MARTIQFGAAILLLLLGGVWLLQGLNILPGSFMTGSAAWGIAGALLIAAGAVILSRLFAR